MDLELVVHYAQWLLVILASYLLFTIVRLSRRDARRMAAQASGGSLERYPAPARIESIAQLQKFTANQLLELRLKGRSEEHTSELQSRPHLVCRLLLEKKKKI